MLSLFLLTHGERWHDRSHLIEVKKLQNEAIFYGGGGSLKTAKM